MPEIEDEGLEGVPTPKGDEGNAPPAGDKTPEKKVYLIDGKPVERWDDLYGKYGAYKELGTADEIKQRLEEHAAWKKAVEEHREKQKQQQAPDPKDKIRKQLLEVMPELGELSSIGELKERHVTANMEKASSHLKTLLGNEKLEVEPEVQEDIEDYLVNKMTESQLKKFLNGDLAVLDEAFKSSLSKGLLATLKAKSTPKPPPPPKRHGSGGTPPATPSKIKTLDDAGDAAWERLSNG